MDKIEFEAVEEKHLGELLDIYNYYVLHTTVTWHDGALSMDDMRELVAGAGDRFATFAVRSGGSVCGYVSIRPFKTRPAYRDTAEIGIYLRKDACGRGIGRAALNHIEEFARRNGFHVLIAAISADNEDSIRLFEKAGYEKCAYFKEVGKKFGRLLDCVDYQKILN